MQKGGTLSIEDKIVELAMSHTDLLKTHTDLLREVINRLTACERWIEASERKHEGKLDSLEQD